MEQMRRRDELLPAFYAILTDPGMDAEKVSGVFYALANTDARGEQWVQLAVLKLTDPDYQVRDGALYYIGLFATERDVAPVLALLSDPKRFVRFAAVQTLAKLGGKHELGELDLWLEKGTTHRKDGDYMRHVKECRDSIEKRLNEAPKDKK